MDFDAHRLSFGAVAEHYDRVRPTYPRAAIDWALGPAPKKVVDLGAGTGLLTRALIAAGHEVIPVEPDPGMRAQLDAATPGVTALAGSAEDIPLPDNSIDAVLVGQAYHWFDRDLANPEIARVLRPGGILAPMWNERVLSAHWTVRLEELIDEQHGHQRTEEHPDFGPLFTDHERQTFSHSQTQTPQGLCDLFASRSSFLVASPDKQAAVLRTIRQACEAELGGQETFELPYRTEVYRATLRS